MNGEGGKQTTNIIGFLELAELLVSTTLVFLKRALEQPEAY